MHERREEKKAERMVNIIIGEEKKKKMVSTQMGLDGKILQSWVGRKVQD